ncbi:MAG: PP2C family protein-serine/threonine phosphatase, partial [Nannocystaceae bacterium]
MKLRAHGVTHVGRKRDHNEDFVLSIPDLGLFAVCDGMGGHHAGDVAAATTGRIIEAAIRRQHASLIRGGEPDTGCVLAAMRVAVEEASQEVYRLARTTGGRHGMGTTCTVLMILGGKGFMAHVGDSRLYLARDHRFYQLSDDHTYMREAIRMGMMTDEQAKRSKFANVVTRGVGVQRSVCVDTLSFDVVSGDRFLLCSDGLHRYGEKEPGALVERLGDGDPEHAAATLVGFANTSGGEDNIGVLVVHADVPDAQAAPREQRRRLDLNENLDAI